MYSSMRNSFLLGCLRLMHQSRNVAGAIPRCKLLLLHNGLSLPIFAKFAARACGGLLAADHAKVCLTTPIRADRASRCSVCRSRFRPGPPPEALRLRVLRLTRGVGRAVAVILSVVALLVAALLMRMGTAESALLMF